MGLISTFKRRATPLAAIFGAAALLATFTAVFVSHPAAVAAAPAATAVSAGHDHGNPPPPPRGDRQVAFHDQMRKLWEDHVTWTRLAIVTFADGSAGFDATAARLLQNQTDIGNAIKPFYGDAAGNRLTSLLHDHITIAVDVLQAAKAGDTAAFNEAKDRWYANANDIADFLSAANPRFWPDGVMRASMRTHLDQTLTEAADELGGNYTASVDDYEAVHLHILAMADLLSSGIIRQFPRKFH
jgi:hypothetical protein